ncbi:MAG: YbgC/FadM family acyl-CoA thioesterase [Sphingomonadaceae bacterium]|nr:YbgC/FadM family acyl-CoA thioesterase [Sphingomonadaceae bacterium]
MSLLATGHIDRGVHALPLRVYFEDTDLTGVVYHAGYIRFMERARTEMLRVLGLEAQALLDAREGFFAVYDLAVTYLAPARLDDVLTVRTRIVQVRAAATVIAQDIWRGGAQLTRGRVTAAWLGMDGRPQRQPRAWADRFTALLSEYPA